jgi:hypothetical protein
MIVVVYRKSDKSKTRYMTVFVNEKTPDNILKIGMRKPLLSDQFILDEIGIGERFIEDYKTQYKITKHAIHE